MSVEHLTKVFVVRFEIQILNLALSKNATEA